MVAMKDVLQYTTVEVTGSNAENLVNGLASLGEKKRKIERIWFSPAWTATHTNNIVGVAKVQQTEVLRFDLTHVMDADADTDQYLSIDRSLPMDLMLERGEAFNVGLFKSGGTPTGVVSFAYRDLE